MPVLTHTHTHTHTHAHTQTRSHKPSCPGAVINAITDRVTVVSAGHGLLSVLQSHDQVQRWRSSCQSDCPSWSATTEQKANLALRLFVHSALTGAFVKAVDPQIVNGPSSWPLWSQWAMTRLLEREGVTAQQRPLLLAVGSAAGQGDGWWYWLAIFVLEPKALLYLCSDWSVTLLVWAFNVSFLQITVMSFNSAWYFFLVSFKILEMMNLIRNTK